jgi:asparagine synthase (glutamine-hydrolysing)
MTNFIMVADPDPDRRAGFCRTAKPRLAMMDGLVLGECAAGEFAAMWASGPRAPVTTWSDGAGAAVLWGRALADDGRAVEAAELPALWADVVRTMPPAFDGYHVAASYDPHRGLTVGADILGMYPVFWWSDGTVQLVGSSPELFRHHPRFNWTLDLAGMVGILLTSLSVNGRTLMNGVNRLELGHLLVGQPHSGPREVRQYELPASTDHFDLPYSKAVELLYETLKGAVTRHVPANARSAISLSGGRDSRLVAGLMAQIGRPPTAITFGNDDDFEMQCARTVTDALKIEHHACRLPFDQHQTHAKLHARWLHCTTGFNSLNYWNSHYFLESQPPFLATGYLMDPIIGGSHMDWPYAEGAGGPSFENVFARFNALGINVDVLKRLLRRDVVGDLLDEVILSLKDDYNAYSPFDGQKATCFELGQRLRFHIGNPPWSFSFGAWPVLPAVDKEVLRVCGGLPTGVLAERRAQDDLIRRYFPVLAELPLDRNNSSTRPLSPRLRYQLAQNLRGRTARWTKWIPRRKGPQRERQYYARLYDFNGSTWKAARMQAECYRERLHPLLNKEVLDELLPPPERDVALVNGIADASSKKALVGLCLWASEYL